MASTRIGSGGPVGYLAEILGASEPALKLLLTIFFGLYDFLPIEINS